VSAAFDTVARGDNSGIVTPRRAIVRDADDWQALWAEHAGADALAPEVDFGDRMIAAVFAGERPTPGFDIAITDARREGAALALIVTEATPPADRVVAQVITSPFHIVRLPRNDGDVVIRDARSNPADEIRLTDSVAPASSTVRKSQGQPVRSRRDPAAPSSTGLTPQVAAALAYLAGPFSGALLLATESTSRFVKFHAWQALLGLGGLMMAALTFLVLAFALLIVSATAFWTMLWIAAITAAMWLGIWAMCLVQAYHGRLWKLPLLGPYAEKRAGIR
jgi:uncharacterized membrane protein